ncbi:Ig-like domain repeat protein [Kitasatospora sp. NPDC089509]|uniref:Ig-like domain repeat protein n=1 Tax=Kitasatospora sp. NPDC089509 TaxID=3364079 RepID=UPI00381E1215
MTFSLSEAPAVGHRPGSAGRRGRALAVAAGVLCAAVAPVALAAPAHAAGACTTTGTTTTCTFATAGADQAFTVPAGVTRLSVTATGAEGQSAANGGTGGSGANVSGTVTVTPGSTLYVNVDTGGGPAGGVPDVSSGGTGGGSSDIRTCASTAANCVLTGVPATDPRLIVAAGGGGGGGGIAQTPATGATGGNAGDTGGSGGQRPQGAGGGGGATQAAGGTGGAGCPAGPPGTGSGTMGEPGAGGQGGGAFGGGGGGGGWFGGGGGGGCVAIGGNGTLGPGGGGGGSNLVPSGGTSAVASGPAQVTLTYTTGKPVTTTLTALIPVTRVGRPVVLSDLVCPAPGSTTKPTGTVTFTDTTTGTALGTEPLFLSLGHCAAAGLVTTFHTTGTHTITAVYSGDSVYQGNGGNPETTTVTVN